MIREDFNLLPFGKVFIDEIWEKYCNNCINKKLTKNFKGISGETIEESFDIKESPEGFIFWKIRADEILTGKGEIAQNKVEEPIKAGDSKSECVGDTPNVVGTAVNPHEHTHLPPYQNPEGRHGALPDKKHHLLKLNEKWWDRIMSGQMPFNVRYDNGDYQAHDTICYERIADDKAKNPMENPDNEFVITYVFNDPSILKAGYYILGIKRVF